MKQSKWLDRARKLATQPEILNTVYPSTLSAKEAMEIWDRLRLEEMNRREEEETMRLFL